MNESIFDKIDYEKDCEMWAKYKGLTMDELSREKIRHIGNLRVKTPGKEEIVSKLFYLLPYVLI